MYVTGSGLPSLFVTQFILESSYGTNEFVLVQSCFRFHVCITAYQWPTGSEQVPRCGPWHSASTTLFRHIPIQKAKANTTRHPR
jgi:hypothetical protein